MNQQRLYSALERSPFDALVITSPENVAYLAGAEIHSQRTIPDRIAAVVIVPDRDPIFVVCNLEETQAREDSTIADIRTYFEFRESPIQIIVDALGNPTGPVALGIETHHMVARYFTEFQERLPQAKLGSCDRMLDEIRMVKEPDEIDAIERAARVTDDVIHRVFSGVRAGDTEARMSARLQSALLEAGADRVLFIVAAAGKNTLMTHPNPGSYQLAPGDVVRTDFGGAFDGYNSDLARTAVIGTPSQEQRDVYRFIWEIHEELIDAARPGVEVRELFGLCKRRYEEHGWPFTRPHIGHSLGMGLHEHPMITANAETVFEPNMVFCLEPNHIVPGIAKYHVEDTIEITQSAPRILSRGHDWSELLEMEASAVP